VPCRVLAGWLLLRYPDRGRGLPVWMYVYTATPCLPPSASSDPSTTKPPSPCDLCSSSSSPLLTAAPYPYHRIPHRTAYHLHYTHNSSPRLAVTARAFTALTLLSTLQPITRGAVAFISHVAFQHPTSHPRPKYCRLPNAPTSLPSAQSP
jgi:hypothetical protein